MPAVTKKQLEVGDYACLGLNIEETYYGLLGFVFVFTEAAEKQTGIFNPLIPAIAVSTGPR